MPWFVKIERGIVNKETFDRFVPAHRDYVKALNTNGHQARTGYWRESRGGMLLFKAGSLKEAHHIVMQDPLIANGCVEFDLHEWIVIEEP